ARKGIIYEHEPTSIPARRLAAALREAIVALAPQPSQLARLEEDAAVALRRLEQGARTAADALPGDEPPVFIHVVRRLMPEPGDGPAGDAERPGGPAPQGGRLIIP